MRPPPDSTSQARPITRRECPPGPSVRAATDKLFFEWIGSLGKFLNPDTLFLAAKEGCQDRGSSAYENNVNHLWRGGWKRNRSENSQMASSDCAVLALSIFVLFCVCCFQPQWPRKHFVTESWAGWGDRDREEGSRVHQYFTESAPRAIATPHLTATDAGALTADPVPSTSCPLPSHYYIHPWRKEHSPLLFAAAKDSPSFLLITA